MEKAIDPAKGTAKQRYEKPALIPVGTFRDKTGWNRGPNREPVSRPYPEY